MNNVQLLTVRSACIDGGAGFRAGHAALVRPQPPRLYRRFPEKLSLHRPLRFPAGPQCLPSDSRVRLAHPPRQPERPRPPESRLLGEEQQAPYAKKPVKIPEIPLDIASHKLYYVNLEMSPRERTWPSPP